MGDMSLAGFSLLEVVFALLIVGLSMLPITGFLMNRMGDTVVIESHRYAQERGYDIMTRVMEEVPFETLWASVAKGNPASLRPQSNPSTKDGVVYDLTYTANLASSVFSGSSQACYANFSGNKGVVYEALLEVTDISDPSTTGFTGTIWNDPGTWRELYFDAYRLPEFYRQTNWQDTGNIENDGIIDAAYKTPYCYYDVGTTGRTWGPPERALNGMMTFKIDFPRDQKDRTRPWVDWGNSYCTMKKLRLRIRWNVTPQTRSDPTINNSRRQEIWFVAFKSYIF